MPVPVEFAPSGRVVWVDTGCTVTEAASLAGVAMPGSCGRRALCGLCGVRVLRGRLGDPNDVECERLRGAPEDVRLACLARIVGPVTVRPVALPTEESVLAAAPSGPVVAAVDLGTTSISAVALDAERRVEVGRATVANTQQSFGADVLSRISAALAGKGESLRDAAELSIVKALDASCGTRPVQRLVIAGNSAMTALLTGADVSTLAAAPFSAPDVRDLPPESRLRERVSPAAVIEVVPPVAAFVGGDVLCGLSLLLASNESDCSCLVDMGTNAEVAVIVDGRLTVASAPAGPAFEGWGTTSGGPAVAGAVSSVRLVGDEIEISTIASEPPVWFSGAGLVSAIAALRRAGHLDAEGRLTKEGPLSARFERDSSDVLAVRFGDTGNPLTVTQLDVRNFQLAKAAVRVAVEAALGHVGVDRGQLRAFWVAGAFGQALEARDLVELGIVPIGVGDIIETPGNTSLAGAACQAIDPNFLDAARAYAEAAEVVNLAGQADFGSRLMAALSLAPYDF